VDGSPLKDEAVCLSNITKTLEAVKKEYQDAKTTLDKFFNIA
jgi:hypothetical protein